MRLFSSTVWPRVAQRASSFADQFFWQGLCFVLGAVAIMNLVQKRGLVDHANDQAKLAKQHYDDLAGAQLPLTPLVGRQITWPEGLELIGPADTAAPPAASSTGPRYRAIAILNNMKCELPDLVTPMLVEMRKNQELSPESVDIIIYGADRQGVQSYRRTHRLTHRTYFDANHAFAQQNLILNEPVLLVVDSTNRIVMAATPLGLGRDMWPTVRSWMLGLVRGPHRGAT